MLASIAAVITGHMALGQIRRTPGLGGRGRASEQGRHDNFSNRFEIPLESSRGV